MVAVFTPSIVRFIWSFHSWPLLKQKLKDCLESLIWGPNVCWLLITRPRMFVRGAKVLNERRSFTKRIVLPLALRKIFRIKVILVILFFFLLSIVLYQKLSFDPHDILGVTKDDSPAKIRKQYRRLSMIYHPDKNSSAEARVKYTEVRRAYKMLVDPKAFDEEMATQAGVGDVHVGLPKFLMAKEYRFIAAPLLLLCLFVIPISVLYKLLHRSSDDEIVPRVICTILWTQEQFGYFYYLMGEPENVEKDKPEDIMKKWHVDPDDYDVGLYFNELCNAHLYKSLQLIPEVAWRLKTNKQYYSFLQQYCQLHLKKLETFDVIHEEGAPPKKPLVVALQAVNKRLHQCLELIKQGSIQLSVPGVDQDELLSYLRQQDLQQQYLREQQTQRQAANRREIRQNRK